MTQHKRLILSPVSNNVSQHFLSLIDLALMMVFLHDIVEMIKITNMTFRQCVCVCNNTVIQITSNQHKPKNASVGRGALHFC